MHNFGYVVVAAAALIAIYIGDITTLPKYKTNTV